MRIYDVNLTGGLPAGSAAETGRAQESEKTSRAGTATSPASGASGSNDRVEFSGTLSLLSRTLATFDSSRADRVQALAGQYQSGKYTANSAATATGMVTELLSAGLQ